MLSVLPIFARGCETPSGPLRHFGRSGRQDKERSLWFRRAADLSSSLRALVHNYEVLLSELGHHGHDAQTDPDTMCLDCYGLREAKGTLEWEAPQ